MLRSRIDHVTPQQGLHNCTERESKKRSRAWADGSNRFTDGPAYGRRYTTPPTTTDWAPVTPRRVPVVAHLGFRRGARAVNAGRNGQGVWLKKLSRSCPTIYLWSVPLLNVTYLVRTRCWPAVVLDISRSSGVGSRRLNTEPGKSQDPYKEDQGHTATSVSGLTPYFLLSMFFPMLGRSLVPLLLLLGLFAAARGSQNAQSYPKKCTKVHLRREWCDPFQLLPDRTQLTPL